MTTSRPLRVGIVGAGPAGVYAADILSASGLDVSIDLIERLPAPFGLVRYGVAPDHPHIKHIIGALHKVLERGDMRLVSNVDVGTDLDVDELRMFYDAVIIATGAIRDVALDIPGVELPGCFGAADFVSWYDGHPDVPRSWPLEARHVAVIGAGNVALDISRMLAKRPEDLASSEVPANVMAGLAANPVTDVHLFARRGPAQAKYSPLELRELGKLPGVDVIVYPEDLDVDEGSLAAIESSNQTKQVVTTLTDWTLRAGSDLSAERRIHLHFLHQPVAVLGTDRVTGLRTERTRLNGDGTVSGTGVFHEFEVEAVYRAVGYFGSPVPGVPFDDVAGVIPNEGGRVIGADGRPIPGLYATGWIKRGPVGLIGHTKSDATETIQHLVEDAPSLIPAPHGDPAAVIDRLERSGLRYLTWSGWERLDAYERALGEADGRERVKVVPREEMIAISSGERP